MAARHAGSRDSGGVAAGGGRGGIGILLPQAASGNFESELGGSAEEPAGNASRVRVQGLEEGHQQVRREVQAGGGRVWGGFQRCVGEGGLGDCCQEIFEGES